MRWAKIAASIVLILAIMFVLASFALPVPKGNTWLGFHAYLGITIAIATIYVGASIIFSKSFLGFTSKLKRAYGILCVGFSLLGLAFVQLPLVVYGGIASEIIRESQVTAIAFVFALLAIYIGTRSFARLFDIKSITTAWWFALIPPVVLGVGFSFLPHAPITSPEVEFDGGNAFNIFSMWVTALALSNTLQVKRIAGAQYTNALAWLAVTFIIMLVAVIGHLSLVLPLSTEQWLFAGVVPFIPLLFASLCFLRAAYAFYRITHQADSAATNMTHFTARNFFGKPLQPKTTTGVSSIDIVMYAANLVSDPRNIDPVLEHLRGITARTPEEIKHLAPEDQQTLKQVYLAIENYLIQKENIRMFTRESLRQTIANDLRLTGAQGTFWESLPTPTTPTAAPPPQAPTAVQQQL